MPYQIQRRAPRRRLVPQLGRERRARAAVAAARQAADVELALKRVAQQAAMTKARKSHGKALDALQREKRAVESAIEAWEATV